MTLSIYGRIYDGALWLSESSPLWLALSWVHKGSGIIIYAYFTHIRRQNARVYIWTRQIYRWLNTHLRFTFRRKRIALIASRCHLHTLLSRMFGKRKLRYEVRGYSHPFSFTILYEGSSATTDSTNTNTQRLAHCKSSCDQNDWSNFCTLYLYIV